MLQVDVDAFARWLGKNYAPPVKFEEIDGLRWPIDEEQQTDIWKKKIMEFAEDINVPDKRISVKGAEGDDRNGQLYRPDGDEVWPSDSSGHCREE